MYEDTILPVRNKFREPSRSQTRIYFVQQHTKNSLYFLKWTELVICLLCLCFVIVAVNVTNLTGLFQGTLFTLHLLSVFFVVGEITYPYFKRSVPLLWQLLNAGTNVMVFGILTLLIGQSKNDHAIIKILMYFNGLASVVFLIDLMCKIIISTYLYQTTRVKSVVDVAVSAFFPAPPPPVGRAKSYRTHLTPITYGGTFPIGKDQPPFLPIDRNPPSEGCNTPEKGTRHKSMQTPQYGDCKAVGGACYDFGPSSVERIVSRNQIVQTQRELEEKEALTLTTVPFYLEEERRKKSPWTCSSATNCKKMEARKQASMSTPITYSGTHAVNKDIVPIIPHGIQTTTPRTSPRLKKPNSRSRSEGNSPTRPESFFLDVGRQLAQISEEKLSSENCSLSQFDCAYLPGSVFEESDYGGSMI